MSSIPGYLYRIVKFEHAVEVLKGSLHFSHPSSWEDPYETHIKHEYDHAIFAQCWSRVSVSDAMWRIYSPNMLGVRLRTTREALISAMRSYTQNNAGFKRRLADVVYLSPSKFRKEVSDLEGIMQVEDFSNPSTAADILCVKRRAFNFENEVRAILYNPDAERKEGAKVKPIKVTVDGHSLIDSVMFDPRAPIELCEAMTNYFRDVLQFKGEVGRSKLYTLK